MKFTLLLFALLCAVPVAAQGLSTDFIAPDAKVERIATGFRFTEGPAWYPGGYLLFTDIPNNAIVKWTPTNGDNRGEGKTEIFRQPSGNANGLMFNQTGATFSLRAFQSPRFANCFRSSDNTRRQV